LKDKLDIMFELREQFMSSLGDKMPLITPSYPLDLSDKKSQQYIRDVALKGVEEMFEALQHLKNWKPHRNTQNTELDRDAFIEEIVDAFNYFFSLIILSGFNAEDLFEAYIKKDKIIHDRLNTGY